jgi:hypothetical protein
VSESSEPPSGSGAWQAPAGSSTGRVVVGRYTLYAGGPGGTSAERAPREEQADPSPLRHALAEEEPEISAAAQLEGAVDTASEVTAKVEKATGLLKSFAEGRFELGQLNELLTSFQRWYGEGRFSDAIRLARSLVTLLLLAQRWTDLVRTLRMVRRAAEYIGDTHAQAWALHELGTLSLGADDAEAATRQLERARELRREIGDAQGLEVTEHNLRLLQAQPPWYRPRNLAIAGGAAAILAGVIVLAASGSSSDSSPTTPTSSSITSPTTNTTSGTTSTTSSSSTTTGPQVPKVVIRTPQDGSTTGITILVSGTAGTGDQDANTVTVTVTPVPAGSGTAPEPRPATVDSAGSWSAKVALRRPGDYSAVATQGYDNGKTATSTPVNFTASRGGTGPTGPTGPTSP